MNGWIRPPQLLAGDTVATVSVSGGRAGDADMLPRYQRGKARLEDVFGVKVVEMPNALRGADFVDRHPKARAEDLRDALADPSIRAVIANMGGDDLYRLLPYVDEGLIRSHPKVLLGYSDISTLHGCYMRAGVVSFYGPNVLTPIAQPGALDAYTEDAMRRALFDASPMGVVPPPAQCTPIAWQDDPPPVWTEGMGYRVLQGSGVVRGRLIGGCAGPMRQVMRTWAFPDEGLWTDALIFLEFGMGGEGRDGLHDLRAFAAAGVFARAKGMICPPLTPGAEVALCRLMEIELGMPDFPILTGVAFGHSTPMTVLPMGCMAEVDCDAGTLAIVEAGVAPRG